MTAPVAAAQVHAIAHQSGITAYDLGHAEADRPAYLGEAENWSALDMRWCWQRARACARRRSPVRSGRSRQLGTILC